MLWIALYLPDFSLQLALRAFAQEPPLVISEGPDNRPTVRAASAAAEHGGVRRGIAVAAAQALINQLTVILNSPAVSNPRWSS